MASRLPSFVHPTTSAEAVSFIIFILSDSGAAAPGPTRRPCQSAGIKIEGPTPGRRLPAKTAVPGAASRTVGSTSRPRALRASPLKSTATPFNIRAFRLDAKAELFGPPGVLSSLGIRTSEPEAEFVVLRQAYDDAFRQFSLQARLLQSLASHPLPDGGAMDEASRRVARAHLVYRERRNALAQLLLSRLAKGAVACLAHRAQMERLAYQLWRDQCNRWTWGEPSGSLGSAACTTVTNAGRREISRVCFLLWDRCVARAGSQRANPLPGVTECVRLSAAPRKPSVPHQFHRSPGGPSLPHGSFSRWLAQMGFAVGTVGGVGVISATALAADHA